MEIIYIMIALGIGVKVYSFKEDCDEIWYITIAAIILGIVWPILAGIALVTYLDENL